MNGYNSYVNTLNTLVEDAFKNPTNEYLMASIEESLNQQPSEALRELVPIQQLRSSGAFFTGTSLSNSALESFVDTITIHSRILDPACGTGNLLLKCTEKLPIKNNLQKTVDLWGEVLMGRDLYEQFINVAKLRLILKAIYCGIPIEDFDINAVNQSFKMIQNSCGMTDIEAIQKASHIVINPPYNLIKSPDRCKWAKGKVSSAAVFLENCIMHSQQGTKIVAILPDVLRSGTRYSKWRNLIESRSLINRVERYGQFDNKTDIDVFILECEVAEQPSHRSILQHDVNSRNSILSDKFDIKIGSVVDYRDPHDGPYIPFIKPKNLPTWETIREIVARRKFNGNTFNPPFVVVRRTSRYGDKYRATATIVDYNGPVAVENHLLVLIPKDKKIRTCNELLKILSCEDTNEWLNNRIRCRHLTISSLADLPWWDIDE